MTTRLIIKDGEGLQVFFKEFEQGDNVELKKYGLRINVRGDVATNGKSVETATLWRPKRPLAERFFKPAAKTIAYPEGSAGSWGNSLPTRQQSDLRFRHKGKDFTAHIDTKYGRGAEFE